MPKSSSYLVAVSGGLDSMVLLSFLHSTGYKSLTVCHVNHRLRGEESDLDARLVRQVATECEIPFEEANVDVREESTSRKTSLELTARELRYEALGDLVEKHRCPRVITAHHADDQVETILINFFRGTGSRGIRGMEPVSKREGGWSIYRPLLEIPREVLEQYAEEKQVPFRQDATNFEDFALRNRVRNHLLPTLEEVFERSVRGSVLRAAELASLDERWIEEALGDLPVRENGLDVSALRAMPEAQRNRVVLLWLRERRIPDCGFEEITRVNEILMRDGNPSKVNLPGGNHARRRAGVLFLEKDGDVVS